MREAEREGQDCIEAERLKDQKDPKTILDASLTVILILNKDFKSYKFLHILTAKKLKLSPIDGKNRKIKKLI